MSEAPRGPLPLGRHGRFELLGLLGRGAMGAVYRARDLELQRDVALKVTLQRSEHARERFLREGQIAASLVHPAIVRVHTAGVVEGFPYLACELVAGARTLGEVARELTGRQAVALVAEAARGLGHAHRQGVVHRDVKPDNLLVDAGGRLRVADFGIAAQEGLERLTRTGALVGTPYYMAPELITGRRDVVGPPTDVWSLGVVLHELLSGGAPPFQSAELGGLMLAITSGEPASLGGDVDAQLAAIVRRCLAKEPAERFADGDALADALEAYLGQARPARAPQRMALLVVAAGGVVALAVVLASLALREAPTPPPPASPQASRASPPQAGTPEPSPPVRRRWDEVRALPEDAQLLAAELWLSQQPADHPERERAEAYVRRLGRERPARVLVAPSEPREVEARFLADGTLVTYGRGVLTHWDLHTAAPLARREVSTNPGTPTLTSHGGMILAGGYGDPLHWVQGDHVQRVDGVRPLGVDVSPDGAQVVVGIRGVGQLGLFDAATRSLQRTFGARRYDYVGLAFDATGARVLAARGQLGYDRVAEDALELFDATTGALLWSTPTQGLARVIRRVPDSPLMLVGFNRGALELWDLEQARPVAELEGPRPESDHGGFLSKRAVPGSVRGIAIDPEARVLYVTCSSDGGDYNQLTAFDLDARAALGAPLVRDPWPLGCDLSPDGRLLAVGTSRGRVEVWVTRALR